MITVLTGENSFLLGAELRRLIAAFVAEYSDMGLERLDGEEVAYDRMREALESLPFLSSKKLVVLSRPSANKEFTEKAADLLHELPETTDLVLVEPKLDKRLAYYKFLKKQTTMQEFAELDEFGLAKWLVGAAAGQGGVISQSDARYLVERVGVNQQLLSQELKKLLTYNPSITKDMIDELTERTPQSTIFELLDAALAGQGERALALYAEQRALKVEPQQIIALLTWQLHVLAVVKAAKGQDAAEIARAAKLNPFVVRKSQAIAARLQMSTLKQLVGRTLDLDIRLKSEAIDADEALSQLLLSLNPNKKSA